MRHLTGRELLLIFMCLCLIVAQVWLSLKLPDFMAEITRLVQTPHSAMRDILYAGGMMMLCTLGIFVITFIAGFFVAKTSSGLAMRLRRRVFDKTMSFSIGEMNKFSTASSLAYTQGACSFYTT